MIPTLLILLALSSVDDEASLEQYFLRNVTAHKMVLDRESDKSTVSVAATGFGYYAWAVAARRGRLSREAAIAWMDESLTFVQQTSPKKNRGWLYHFTDPEGRPKFDGEVSSIDTALFFLGARKAAQTLGDARLSRRVEEMIAAVEVAYMLAPGQERYFSHCFYWEGGRRRFSAYTWDDYSEGVLLYRLFNKDFKPRQVRYDLPLFVYYYPLCFYDDPGAASALCKAVEHQLRAHGACGITACDGPGGYCVNDPRIISPLALWAVSRYSEPAATFLRDCPHPRTTPSYCRHTGRVMADRIGIDCGSTLMLVAR